MEVVQIGSVEVEQKSHASGEGEKTSLERAVRALLNSLPEGDREKLAAEILGEQVQDTGVLVDEDELLEDFLEDSENRGLAEGSLVSYRSVLKRFSRYQTRHGKHLAKIDRDTLTGFLARLRDLEFAPNTLTNYFSIISSLCDYLVFRELLDNNPVPAFMKRYLRRYKKEKSGMSQDRQLISIEEMANLINSTVNVRNKAVITLLAKTGIRRDELVNMDLEDIDWTNLSIKLKPHPKRTNRLIFFDDETTRILKSWLRVRPGRANADCNALFVGETGNRLKRSGIYNLVTKQAEKAGLHNPDSSRMEDRFTPHCCRHWFTTMLARSGIARDLLKELRGDARNESMDFYRHIDPEELRKAYLAHIPELGV